MSAHTNVADAAERTFQALKPMNKRLKAAKTRAEKDAIEAEIAALKAAWFVEVADDLAAVRSARGVQP